MKAIPAGNKNTSPSSVDDYIAGVAEPARTTLKKIRAAVRAAAPAEATEVISYGMPTFKYKGMLFSYAAFKDHCSIFPGKAPIVALADALEKFEISNGTIRFSLNKPPSARLIKKLVKARVAENDRKQA